MSKFSEIKRLNATISEQTAALDKLEECKTHLLENILVKELDSDDLAELETAAHARCQKIGERALAQLFESRFSNLVRGVYFNILDVTLKGEKLTDAYHLANIRFYYYYEKNHVLLENCTLKIDVDNDNDDDIHERREYYSMMSNLEDSLAIVELLDNTSTEVNGYQIQFQNDSSTPIRTMSSDLKFIMTNSDDNDDNYYTVKLKLSIREFDVVFDKVVAALYAKYPIIKYDGIAFMTKERYSSLEGIVINVELDGDLSFNKVFDSLSDKLKLVEFYTSIREKSLEKIAQSEGDSDEL